MNATNIDFSPLSFIKVRLLKEPIYRRDQEEWETLRAGRRAFGWQVKKAR